jgi:F-type H+-transporting ATPase subunit epsilon
MATFHFDLVSPEKLLYSREVEQVDVPGSEGDFGVLAGHAPLVAIIKPGILTIYNAGNTQRLVVLGGFAEVSPQGLTVLADAATAVEDIDHATIAAHIKQTEDKVTQMEQGSLLDREIVRLDHFKTLQMQLTSTAMH